MQKAYNSVGWEHLRKSLVRIKMCDKFIQFFGSIHNDRVNRVMMNFGLTDGYRVHDSLDQGEVFSPLLWRIFYDPLLCEVKRQKSVCGYRLDSCFVANTGRIESWAGLTSFLAAGAFVDDTIWIGSSQAATQHILNVTSEFFQVNDISINNDKMVAISINCKVSSPRLLISGLPILIAKRGEPHWYLGIFLSTEGLSKPSLAKAYLDVQFFTNLVLRKAISDKQFSYLVSAVLHSIIAYRTQFSFVSISVCAKWDTLICKGLKSKSGLPLDFPNDAIHHPSLYGLKSFEQVQAESKSAAVVCFANSVGILGHLFVHRSHDLQVLNWCPRHSLLFPSYINISPLNNFLAGVVWIFLGCNLSLSGTPMSIVLDELAFYKCVSSLRQYGIVFVEQLCDRTGSGPIPDWFNAAVHFLSGSGSSPVCSLLSLNVDSSDVLVSCEFDVVCNRLLEIDSNCLSLFTDGSLCGLGTLGIKTGTAVFFEDIDLGLGVEVSGLVSSTMMELQAIALALECVPSSHSVNLFSDSQAALDACRSELILGRPDFRNQCWVEHRHISNVICRKNLDVNWIKVKGHSGVLGNEHADTLAKAAVSSGVHLPHKIDEHFLKAGGTVVSGNSRHFVGSGSRVLVDSLRADVDWSRSCSVWHPDSHLAAGFTSARTAGSRTYFMKALHHHLPVAGYLSVLCLFCGNVEISDHVFSCPFDAGDCACSDAVVSTAICKSFVFNKWYCESFSVFKDAKTAAQNIVAFVRKFCLAFRDDIWLVRAKHRAVMKKGGLIPCDGSIPVSISGLSSVLSSSVVRLLGMADAFSIGFGFHESSLFFSGVGKLVSVRIVVIEPVGSSTGGFGLGLAGLETHPHTKKKCVKSIYSCITLYKKPKKPNASGVLVNLSIGPLILEDIGISGNKPTVFWGSEVGSIANSISDFSDIENMEETKVATKTPTLTVLEFCHAIYTQNQSNLELPEGCCLAEFAFTYYINARINYHIRKEEEPHNAKLGLYRELSQYTTKEVAVIVATIVKIYQEIEQYANENFSISIGNTKKCTNKTKENLETNQKSNQQKLGTSAQTPKKTVTQSIKKQCIYSPEDKSYHFSPENKIQIPLEAALSLTSIPQMPRTLSYTDKIKQHNWEDIPITRRYLSLFQNPFFQPKFGMEFENHKEESKSESEKETKPDIREATFRNAQRNIIPPLLRPISPPAENSDKMATSYITRLTDFSGEKEEMDVYIWLREAQKAIQANNWNNQRAIQTLPFFLKGIADLWYQSLETKLTSFAKFKNALLEYFSNPNAIIQLQNKFNTIKQNTDETVTQYFA
ncbi:hypothetical protein G9A89_007486 [Geosiphon pyriformis]|nr:hypothetical protein G9A89_007486 [Geosiphon pyriformis]